MNREDLRPIFHDLPGFSRIEWEYLYKFIQDWKPRRCLDLGFGQGVNTICMAAAMKSCGQETTIISIDAKSSQNIRPNIAKLRERTGLTDADISVLYEESSFNWSFIEMLENEHESGFDLIHIDGRKSWNVMGLAALLAQKLLNRGGWLVLNGADFNYASGASDEEWVRNMPAMEQTICQVNKVFDLLVCKSPEMSVCRRKGKRFFAQRNDRIALKEEGGHDLKRKMAICNVLHRANQDPDFRFGLLWNTEQTLRSSKDEGYESLFGAKFAEGRSDQALGQEYEHDKDCFYLQEPTWTNLYSREDLKAMIVFGSGG